MMGHSVARLQLSRTRVDSIHHPIAFADVVWSRSSKLSETLTMESHSKRPTCPACSKPIRICLCRRIRSPCLDNPVSVTILQHSLERKHALNSTRIARLGLRNVTVTTVFDVDCEAEFVIKDIQSGNDLGFAENGAERSDWDHRFENGEALKLGGYVDHSSRLGETNIINIESERNLESLNQQRSSLLMDHGNHPKRQKSDESLSFCRHSVVSKGNAVEESRSSEELIRVTMRKHGVISRISHSLKLRTGEEDPSFKHILASGAATDVLAKGFAVMKISEEQQEFELEVPPGSVLLFPSEESVTIVDLKATGFEPRNLIVLDGTWAKAKRMYLENPWLKLLRHVKLDMEAASLYGDVRRQPKPGCMSTLESIVYAMKEIGNYPRGLENLLDVFGLMVEDQRKCKDARLRKVSESQ
ncbi:PREDICTED: uncharacterized protein LOC104817663 [Tarenaya hassleriana]|uniref:uncharacterized protein LOC104817663 n=1 Tax=Tarenaya hassleriana TaxID=28532 RepID=UPI00053C986F|nr:PREDICTED: uncharacterized protein LOC104817663 [Tarenaya hassleriana]